MIAHHEYMKDGAKLHRAYYGQFVTDGIKGTVARMIGMAKILKSKDPHFNDISIYLWDQCGLCVNSANLQKAVKETGTWVSMATLVCITKEAARQLREEELCRPLGIFSATDHVCNRCGTPMDANWQNPAIPGTGGNCTRCGDDLCAKCNKTFNDDGECSICSCRH